MNSERVMPALSEPHSHFHHTLSSAIESLLAIGVSVGRIRVRRRGREAPGFWVIAQSPAPGEPIEGVREFLLDVAELGCFHRLPFGYRCFDDPARFGTADILAMFDDVFAHSRHMRDEASRLFDISPRRPAACARWLRLFGLEPEDWPEDKWFPVAVMAASLHTIAGTGAGLRWGLANLMRMELLSIRFGSDSTVLDAAEQTRLGQRFSRVGIDTIAGGKFLHPRRCVLRVRLRSVADYRDSCSEAGRRRTDSVMRLLLPLHLNYELDRVVGDPSLGCRLAGEPGPSRSPDAVLKITAYLGRPVEASTRGS